MPICKICLYVRSREALIRILEKKKKKVSNHEKLLTYAWIRNSALNYSVSYVVKRMHSPQSLSTRMRLDAASSRICVGKTTFPIQRHIKRS